MPKILLTNDDGIEAPGLFALYQAMREKGDVVVVAPDRERSGTGHGITLTKPLRYSRVDKHGEFYGYSVNGTPVDCVKIAEHAILKGKPDMIISGINLGSNTGVNTIYSGTVAAALEGAVLEVPSFAISLTTFENPHFETAANFAARFFSILLESNLPTNLTYNINVPNLPESEIKGVRITRQGASTYDDHYEHRRDPRGQEYFWLTGERVTFHEDGETDDGAIDKSCIAVTPIQFDLTAHHMIDRIKSWESIF